MRKKTWSLKNLVAFRQQATGNRQQATGNRSEGLPDFLLLVNNQLLFDISFENAITKLRKEEGRGTELEKIVRQSLLREQ
ncbi:MULTISPECIES: hypothetical protein [Okeania]|uniref:Uncharacterized protein n=1 Tax=Okeania hirsuta TaxID=1458930 RepID=A0A3N6RD68_9CYAN|nr:MULTISPECIES: hypothetical protein [Okeania]NET16470.1 hypothetical protein [Okeania sp. SIO1H6]NET23117.1 hypothetical protein [Okeania sp. SIO1H5]NES91138.1 hypothetical protein [Okeania sp. SIO2B9]NET76427.1 hypothetical protein [Okeania sp. SIO1F9]NET96608.1 hypothetical protein [Okeania sp. SIO1H2]